MYDTVHCDAVTLQTADAIASSLHTNLVEWRVKPQAHGGPIVARIRPHCLSGGVRLIELSGGPFNGERSRAEIARDGDEYLGVLFQRSGSTLCKVGDSRTLVGPGEVCVWLSERPTEFEMPSQFQKLCLLIPLSRFEGVLHNATAYEGLHLPTNNHLTTLLGSYLTTLSEEVAAGPGGGSSEAVDVTLELLGAAFRVYQSQFDRQPHYQLRSRILRYIEAHLDDASLTPLKIAKGNGISLRYLYLVFSEQGMTVAGWVRQRRLARCRAELDDVQNTKTITEVAYRWGFNDSAHFSRLFKSSFGVSPSAYKALRTGRGI